MVLNDSVHLSNRHDGPYTKRNTYMGDCSVACTSLRNICVYGLDCRQNLPRGYLYARQKAIIQRPLPLDEVLGYAESVYRPFSEEK